jgi:hypothetical protein
MKYKYYVRDYGGDGGWDYCWDYCFDRFAFDCFGFEIESARALDTRIFVYLFYCVGQTELELKNKVINLCKYNE